jgi:hypothetical protein
MLVVATAALVLGLLPRGLRNPVWVVVLPMVIAPGVVLASVIVGPLLLAYRSLVSEPLRLGLTDESRTFPWLEPELRGRVAIERKIAQQWDRMEAAGLGMLRPSGDRRPFETSEML